MTAVGYCRRMTAWLSDEVGKLANRWQGDIPNPKTLPGACPNCKHGNAFRGVSVRPYSPTPLRSDKPVVARKTATDVPEMKYPANELVRCGCGHESHGTAGGCGRSGRIPI